MQFSKFFRCAFAGLAVASVLSSCGESSGGREHADGSVSLKFAFPAGSKFSYNLDTRMIMDMTMGGQSMQTTNNMVMNMVSEVTSAEGGNRKMTSRYDEMMMEVKNAMTGAMKYDSKDTLGSHPMLAQSMGKLLNKPFTMTINDQGEIVKVEGLSEAFKSMGNAGTNSQFSDSSIRSMMQQSFNIYPDHPVKPGDTWKKNWNADMGIFRMTIDNEYKLVSVANGQAKIDVNAKISLMGNKAELKEMKMNISGDQKGTMDVDVATGMILNSVQKQTIAGDMEAGGMTMPFKVSSDIKVTGKKL